MTFRGAGLAPFGSSNAGTGSDDTVGITSALWVKSDGTQGNARFIDPVSGDYAVDANGYVVGQNAAQQMVYLALLTVLGSSADATLGQNFSKTETVSANFKNKLNNQVQSALAGLVKQKLVMVNSIIVDAQGSKVSINVQWTDASTGINNTTKI